MKKQSIVIKILLIAVLTALAIIAFGSYAPAEDTSRGPHREYFTHDAPNGSEYIEWETPRGMVCVFMPYESDALDCEFPR